MSGGHDDPGFIPRRFVLAEFATPEALLEGTTKVRAAGHKGLDTHTPYPVYGIDEALGLGRPKIPTIVLLGAIAGACIAYSMTSSATARSLSGTVNPSALAVFVLITISNLTGVWTGSSLGFSPFRMRSA